MTKSKRQWLRDNPELRKAYNAKYYAKNVLRCREACKAWRARNPEAARELKRRYHANNPNSDRNYRARRKLREAWAKFARTCAGNRGMG